MPPSTLPEPKGWWRRHVFKALWRSSLIFFGGGRSLQKAVSRGEKALFLGPTRCKVKNIAKAKLLGCWDCNLTSHRLHTTLSTYLLKGTPVVYKRKEDKDRRINWIKLDKGITKHGEMESRKSSWTKKCPVDSGVHFDFTDIFNITCGRNAIFHLPVSLWTLIY